jgi:hypothetical protein
MKPEDLSQAVAVHVMGWKEKRSMPPGYSGEIPYWFSDDGKRICRCDIWRPHNNANDAMRVVDRMRQLGHAFSSTDLTGGYIFSASFARAEPPSIVRSEGKGNILSIAICKAALHSVLEMMELTRNAE